MIFLKRVTMKKVNLFLNLAFLTILAFLSAAVLVLRMPAYAAAVAAFSPVSKPAIICGKLNSYPENVKDPANAENHMRDTDTGTGGSCLHQSGIGALCFIPSTKRRKVTVA
jgi:hypothetical protein